MDALRIGRVVRALHRRRNWRQEDLAIRARVSRSKVSRIESGQGRAMTLQTLDAVAAPLGLSLDLVPRWQGEALDRLLDEGHAALVDSLVRRYVAAGWEVAVEASFAIDGERGSIDVLAFHPSWRLLAVNEVKSVVADAQATVHTLDRKTRLAPRIAASRGWRPGRVLRFLVVNDDRTSRRRVDRFAALFAAAFPVRGRLATRWIDRPDEAAAEAPGDSPVAALFFLSAAQRPNTVAAGGGRHRVRTRATA